MFHAQLFERFLSRLGASGPEILEALADLFHRLVIVLPLPLQCSRENVIEGDRRFLPVSLSIIVQLRLAFWRKMYLHGPRVGSSGACVKLRYSIRNGDDSEW